MNKQNGNAIAGLITFIVVVGIIGLLTSVRFVGTGKIGVVTNFGRVTGRELTAGVSLVAPFWMETVKRYDIKVQKEETADVAAATKDLQDVKSTVVVNYQLEADKVSEIHESIGKSYSEKLIAPAVQELFKASSAKYTAAESITQRNELKNDVLASLKKRLSKYGINVLDVSLTNFAFSAAFNTAIEQTQVAQQEVIKAKNELEKAKVDAEKRITAAQGDAEAQRLQQETLTPELLTKMEIETRQQAIAKWNGQMPTTTAGDSDLLFGINK